MDMKINAKPVTKPAEGTSPQKEPDRLQKLLWENRYVLLSFGGAIVVFILICIAYRMIPFGDVTILRMDVPCCGGLQRAAETALQNSGKFIPRQVVTISRDGRILD